MRNGTKEPQFGLLVVILIAVSAFCCGGGIYGLGGLLSSRKDEVAVAPPSHSDSASERPKVQPPSSVALPLTTSQGIATQPAPVAESPTVPASVPQLTSTESSPQPKVAVAASAVQVQPGRVPLLTASQPLRAWKSRDGAFTTTAKFVGLYSGKARLDKLVKNEVVDVPIEQLSAADQTYVGECIRVDSLAHVIFGKVTAVADGDTLTVLDLEQQQHTIRLEGIDAPEGGQAYGSASKEALSTKVFGKSPWTEWRDTDKYGRTLGHIYLDGRHINLEMVADGFAWHYKQYSTDPRLANAEVVARGKRLGLWNVNSAPTPPWEFRHPQPMPVEVQGLLDRSAPGQETQVVYVTRTGMSYHAAGCRFLAKSSIAISLDDARARYKPCSVCNPPR
jgi:Micrococcal nuclease (thermonuclease) homologs